MTDTSYPVHLKPDCVFCRIVMGDEPANIVMRSNEVIAFHPLNPVTVGHLLFVPTVHIADPTEDPGTAGNLMMYAAQSGQWWVKGDVNYIINQGRGATQTIGHLHLHLVPRHRGDGLMLPWTNQKRNDGGL